MNEQTKILLSQGRRNRLQIIGAVFIVGAIILLAMFLDFEYMFLLLFTILFFGCGFLLFSEGARANKKMKEMRIREP